MSLLRSGNESVAIRFQSGVSWPLFARGVNAHSAPFEVVGEGAASAGSVGLGHEQASMMAQPFTLFLQQ